MKNPEKSEFSGRMKVRLICLMAGLIFFSPLILKAQTTEENVEPAPLLNEVVVEPDANPVPSLSSPSEVIDLLDLKNMDALDVFKLIAQKSGLNIVAGQNVKGRITIYLKNVTALDALKIIVESYGWAYEQDQEIIKITTDKEYEDKYGSKFGKVVHTRIKQLSYASAKDLVGLLTQLKSSSGKIITDDKSNTLILMDEEHNLDAMEDIVTYVDIPVKTEVFQLNYAKADELSKKISEMLTPTVGTIKFDERSNKLVVSDSPARIKSIAQVVTEFNQKDKEVYIEAKIIQIILSDEFKMGVDWQAIIADYHNLDLKSNLNIFNSTDKRGKISVGTLSDDNYTGLLEALKTVGTTNILSSPRIAAVNNKEAKILVGSTEPYVTTTVTTPASGPTTTAESVNFIEVGVKLFVTPTIHEDGFITMKIKPEVSSVVRTLTTSTNNQIPIVETSEAETTVMVKDATTVVIGGLIKDERVKSENKVPFLGDIPFFGAAFRNVSSKTSKTELVIFLTPHIMTGDAKDPPDDESLSSLPQ